ncbi:Protein of unknown function [Gryllus bimaculatus]|nr:Protein of unknown function [Gryllus bimaculatus]
MATVSLCGRQGDAELGIPVLDPLVVDEWEFAVDEEPLVSAEGSLSQARLEGLGAFVVEKSKISISVLPPRATVTVGVRVPAVSAVGNYRLSGEAHTRMRTDISVDADGDFTVVVKDISFLVKAVVTLSFKVKSVDVTLGLGDVDINVQGAAAELRSHPVFSSQLHLTHTSSRPAPARNGGAQQPH